MAAIRTLLIPTDFSDHAERAVQLSVEWARAFGARIHLIHVLRLPPPGGGLWGAGFPTELAKEMREYVSELLAQTRQKIEAEGIAVSSEVLEGEPAAQIVSCARRKRADLIVMGTRGLSGAKHVLLGSVAERTLRHAPCPVMTSKAPAG